jgi:hypothetical protein
MFMSTIAIANCPPPLETPSLESKNCGIFNSRHEERYGDMLLYCTGKMEPAINAWQTVKNLQQNELARVEDKQKGL